MRTLCCLVGLFWWVGLTLPVVAQTTTDDRGYIVKVGDKVPPLTLQLTDGQTLNLRQLRGKVVVLQFTASWCGVCRHEMPFLESEVWQAHKDKDFVLIGVDYKNCPKSG